MGSGVGALRDGDVASAALVVAVVVQVEQHLTGHLSVTILAVGSNARGNDTVKYACEMLLGGCTVVTELVRHVDDHAALTHHGPFGSGGVRKLQQLLHQLVDARLAVVAVQNNPERKAVAVALSGLEFDAKNAHPSTNFS